MKKQLIMAGVLILCTICGNVLGTDTVLFRDDFNGSISSQWHVLRPADGMVMLATDHLEMAGVSGDFNTYGNGPITYSNFYTILTPTTGDFAVTVKLNSFNVAGAGQFDLLAFDDDRNYVKTDVGYFRNEIAASVAGQWGIGWGVANNPSQYPAWLRLTKVGNQYTSSVSIDGTNFTVNPIVVTYGNGQPLLLGFDVTTGSGSLAKIDYFEVNSIPEPATLLLLGVGGMVLRKT